MATLENPFEKVRPKMVAARIELFSHLAKFTHEQLTMSPAPDEWSALDIAHHVYLSDGEALEQMHQVQEEENPQIQAFDDESNRRKLKAEKPPVSLEAVLGGMAARREEIFEYLNTLPPADWERPLRHSRYGPLQFYQLVNILPQHDQIHARQLADLKAAIALTRS